MNHVLKTHREYVAILLFHGYIQGDGRFTCIGKQMFEQVVKPNPNVRPVLCGHVNGTAFRSDDLDDNGDKKPDRRVNAMLYNYQDFEEDCGQLCLLTFDPATRGISVVTYSPHTNRYYRDAIFSKPVFKLDGAY